MGCCSPNLEEKSKNYNVELYRLIKSEEDGIFEIKLSTTEKFEKKTNENNFIIECSECNNNILSDIILDDNMKKNSIFYIYAGQVPAVKNYKQMKNVFPFKIQSLKKIIILLINEALEENYTKDLIKRAIENLEIIEEIELDLGKLKEKFQNYLNSSITDDDLKLTDNNENDINNNITDDIYRNNEFYIEEVIGNKTLQRLEKELFNKEKKNNEMLKKKNNTIDININIQSKEKDNNNNKDESQLNQIDKVIIKNSKITQNEIFIEIIEQLIKYKNLKKFSFYNNNFNSNFDGWIYIGKLFEENYNIRCIDLHCSNLYDYNLENLVDGLKNKRIRYLDLSENFLSYEGMNFLSKFLKSNKTLQRLYLQRNGVCQFKKDGVEIVCMSLIKHPNLKYIDFSFMEITGCGIYINKLIENVNLEHLSLRCCKLNYHDFKNICEPMIKNKTINHFDLSMNDQGGNKSLEELSKVIKYNKNISFLYLDKLNINMDNYEIIFNAIEENDNIHEISFSLNPKLNIKSLLNFFIKKNNVKSLEYIPYNSDDIQKKEFTLEEKKLIEKFKKERSDMKLIIH